MRKINVTMFVTEDGERFESRELAVKHDFALLLRTNLRFSGRDADQKKALDNTVETLLRLFPEISELMKQLDQ